MLLTIFTPTYNRAYTLRRLYLSLCCQTCRSFEWLVIDDGSTDQTRSLIEEFMSEKKINIRYIFQENSGKSVAHNIAVKTANGDLFTCVDSDDFIEENAVKELLSTWEKAQKVSVGILAKRKNLKGEAITKTSLSNGSHIKLKDVYHRHLLSGDTFLIFKTSILKKHLFPKFKAEKFVPEDYIYDQICEEGVLYFLDQFLYICEYQRDGYSANMNKLIALNPFGYRAYLEQRMIAEKKLIRKLMYFIRYESIAFVINKDFLSPISIFFSIISIIPGWIVYLLRFKKYVSTGKKTSYEN